MEKSVYIDHKCANLFEIVFMLHFNTEDNNVLLYI